MTDGITIRRVEPRDGENGLFAVLSQLTVAPALAPARFAQLVAQERAQGLRTTVVAVRADGRVVGTGAVLMEHKFIRGGGVCAHVEDIVVDEGVRGARVGKRIIAELVQLARVEGCYKVSLDCADRNVPFYEKCGFERKECQMTLYF